MMLRLPDPWYSCCYKKFPGAECSVPVGASEWVGLGHLLVATCWQWGEGSFVPSRLPQWEALPVFYLFQDAHKELRPGAGQLKNDKCPPVYSDSGIGTCYMLESKVALLKNLKLLSKTWKLPIPARRVLSHNDISPMPLCVPCHLGKFPGFTAAFYFFLFLIFFFKHVITLYIFLFLTFFSLYMGSTQSLGT